jgi:hypothetical protein
MKWIFLTAIFMSGCSGFESTEGEYHGRLVDVEWHGMVFKSCEIVQQAGDASSHMSECSSRDQEFCDQLKGLIGKTVTTKYTGYSFRFSPVTRTPFICSSVKEAL